MNKIVKRVIISVVALITAAMVTLFTISALHSAIFRPYHDSFMDMTIFIYDRPNHPLAYRFVITNDGTLITYTGNMGGNCECNLMRGNVVRLLGRQRSEVALSEQEIQTISELIDLALEGRQADDSYADLNWRGWREFFVEIYIIYDHRIHKHRTHGHPMIEFYDLADYLIRLSPIAD